MSNKQDFQEAFPANGDYNPGPDYIAVALAVVLVLIIAVTAIALRIPLP